MSYTLRIVFSGLCCFVPDKPFETGPTKKVDVLLRNLFRPIVLSTDEVMAVHIPRLEVAPVNYKSGDRPIDFTMDPDSGRSRHNWIFRFEEISFRPAGAAGPGLTFSTEVPPDPLEDPANMSEGVRKSLYWMAHIKDSLGPRSTVKPELLAPSVFLDNGPLIAARIKIDSGNLETDNLQQGFWRFDPSSEKRRLAESIALEFPGLEADSEIVFRELDQPDTLKIVVGPATQTDGEVVRIDIRNAEIDRFLEHPGTRHVLVDRDFEGYFELFDSRAPSPLLPTSAANIMIAQGGCTPVRG